MGTGKQFDTEYTARLFFGMFYSYFHAEELLMRQRYRPIGLDVTIRAYVDIFARGTVK